MVIGPIRASTDGILLEVRLTPKSSRDQLGPVEIQENKAVFRASVRAVPEKGKANKALCQLLAKKIGMAKSKFEVVAGAKSRHKTVLIRGDAKQLMPRVKEKLI